MTEYGPATYGDRVAEVYDHMPQVLGRDTERAVVTLAELAGPGPVLELGIGTGRLALPLAARGLARASIAASASAWCTWAWTTCSSKPPCSCGT
jgi:hypothetical protein